MLTTLASTSECRVGKAMHHHCGSGSEKGRHLATTARCWMRDEVRCMTTPRARHFSENRQMTFRSVLGRYVCAFAIEVGIVNHR